MHFNENIRNELKIKKIKGYTYKIINISVTDYPTGLRPIYVIFFEFLPISFQMKNNDDMRL